MEFRNKNLRFAEQYQLPAAVFKSTVVAVELRPEAAGRAGNIAAFVFAVNLLARMFEHVIVVHPANTALGRHPWSLDTVDEAIDEINRTVDGSLEFDEYAAPDIVLSIATSPSIPGARQVVVAGSSWCAALDCNMDNAGDGILGSLYAATMGAAQVLLHSLDLEGAAYQPMDPFRFSLLDFKLEGVDGLAPSTITIPTANLVGVGAVGSAAVYALAHIGDARGMLHLIDNDAVDGSNLNRYVLMRDRDVERPKVDIAAKALRSSGIHAEPHYQSYSDFSHQFGSASHLLLSPVDSEEARCALAKTLPRRVINAATGGTTVTLTTHGFADGKACLHCIYMPRPDRRSRIDNLAEDIGLRAETVRRFIETNEPLDEHTVVQVESHRGVTPGTYSGYIGMPILSFYEKAVCGDAEMRLTTANIIAPLSFISAAAGILLAAELIKIGCNEYRGYALDNYFRLDTLHYPNAAFLRTKSQHKSAKCICHNADYRAVYEQKYARGFPSPS